MSDYVVHFTKGDDSGQVLREILASGQVRAVNPFGTARTMTKTMWPQQCACFSEIPLDRLNRLVERRKSSFGIGFRQDLLTARFGGRVWYVELGTWIAERIEELKARALGDNWDPAHPIWAVTPFIDIAGEYPGGPYRFEWEREWRVPGGLTFTTEEVAFLFMPEDSHGTLGDGYVYVDPAWGEARLQEAFAKVAPATA